MDFLYIIYLYLLYFPRMKVCVLNYVKENEKQVEFIHCVEVSDVPEESGKKVNMSRMFL